MFELMHKFQDSFPDDRMKLVKSPLRICPLGAHVDHQHGVVAGMALQVSVNLAYSANEDGYINVQSLDFPDKEYFHLNQVPGMLPGFWGNYIRGAVLSLSRVYKLRYGINAFVSGKSPIGGLSSSAAVTTAYLMALCDVNGIKASSEALIEFSHWAERDFIGLNNGILDQSANILSKARHLMYMDCKTGAYELIPQSPNMPAFEVAVVYSGLSQSLMSTDYNNRVDECKVAAWLLQEMSGAKISALKDVRLRDIDISTYESLRMQLPGRFRRRADHFFAETERVRKGMAYWAQGDLVGFGQLMFESGWSSVNNYECGCPELTTIFQILTECPGVYGARFSGAGYRGCCIGLIDPRYKKEIVAAIDTVYPGQHPAYKDVYKVYFSETDDGARVLSEEELFR